MSTPEPRFEVPPEYAEVYERAYRRAYDGVPETTDEPGFVVPTQRASGDRAATSRAGTGRAGARRAVVPRQQPRQRGSTSSPRGGARRAGRPVTPASVAAELAPNDEPLSAPDLGADSDDDLTPGRRRHRGVPRTGSTLFPLLALVALALILIAGSFVLGRATADRSATEPARRRDGSDLPSSSTSAGASSSPAPYAGATAPLRAQTAAAGCTSAPGLSPQNVPIGYDATNVLDDNPATAWRCDGDAVGQVLDFTLPAHSRVVALGLVPGYAVTDPESGVDLYAQNDRITKVTWILDGRSFVQDISPDTQDRSLRVLRIPETESDRVTLRIDTVDPGPANATTISTVAFAEAAEQ